MRSSPAKTSVYESTIHCNWLAVAPRPPLADGMRQCGDRDVQDRVVQRDHDQAEAEHQQRHPPAPVDGVGIPQCCTHSYPIPRSMAANRRSTLCSVSRVARTGFASGGAHSLARWCNDRPATRYPRGPRARALPQTASPPPREPSHAERCRTLVASATRGALSTISVEPPGYPYGSVASYGLDERGNPLLFVSLMAEHTQNAMRDPRASLLVTEPVPDGADPLASGRVTLARPPDDRSRGRPVRSHAIATSKRTRRRRTTSTSATSRSIASTSRASATSGATAG